jgi:FkbM family methyltransferase
MIKHVAMKTLEAVLPRRAREALFHVAFNVSRDEFHKFAFLYAFAPDMAMELTRLKQRGWSPGSVVDVGTFHGDWSRMARELWPSARLAMVEPNTQLTDQLRGVAAKLNAEFHCELLGASEGTEVGFHVMESGSSILEERSSHPRHHEVRRLRTLDSTLSGWDSIDLLKIDAQGYELEILKGAARLLPKTKSVLLEISVIQTNQDAPVMHDVIAFMKSQGFVSCEILEIHRRPLDMALNQIDILFVREDSPLLADKRYTA